MSKILYTVAKDKKVPVRNRIKPRLTQGVTIPQKVFEILWMVAITYLQLVDGLFRYNPMKFTVLNYVTNIYQRV